MSKKKQESEMQLRHELLKAHQELVYGMEELGGVWKHIRDNNNHMMYNRVAMILDRIKPAAELLNMNLDNDF